MLIICLSLLLGAAEQTIRSLDMGKRLDLEASRDTFKRSTEIKGLRVVLKYSPLPDDDFLPGDLQSVIDLEDDLRHTESFIASAIKSFPLIQPIRDLSQCQINGKDFQADTIILVSFARIGDDSFLYNPCLFDHDLHLIAGSLVLNIDIERQAIKTALKIGTLALLNAPREDIEFTHKSDHEIAEGTGRTKETENLIKAEELISVNIATSGTKNRPHSNNIVSRNSKDEVTKELEKLEESGNYNIEWGKWTKRKLALCDENCATCASDQTSCEQCAAGFFDGGEASCTPCDPTCLSCTGPAATECSTCAERRYLDGNNSCLDCDSTCLTCTGPTATECSGCPESDFLKGTECVETCPDGTFPDGTNCTACHAACVTCTGPETTNCIVCADEKFLNGTVCVDSCPDDKFINEMTCVDACPEEKSVNESTCVDTCPDGKYSESGTCMPCDSLCFTCSGESETDCVICADEKFLNGTDCSDSCPDDKFIDGKTCVESCPEGKFAEEMNCKESCPDGKFEDEESCTDCPTECTTCETDTHCTGCENQYYLTDTNSCIACSNRICEACSDNVCSSCKENATLRDGNCECNPGYYENSGACIELCDLCVSCVDGLSCTCIEYAAPVLGETNPENLCECYQSTEEEGICIPDGDYYTDNNNINRIEFSSNYLELGVYFNESPTYVDIQDATDCAEYFQKDTLAKLGASPTCDRSQDGTSITVILGFGYDLTVENEVYLYWLHIRKSDNGNSTDHVNLSGTATGGDPPTPNIVITGPKSIYLGCEETSFTYSVFLEAGAGNGVISYKWMISPDLQADFTDAELSQKSITIFSSALSSDHADYQIEATATNAFGSPGSSSFLLSVFQESGISLSFAGGSSVQIRSDETRYIEPISEEKCGRTGPVSFVWTFENTETGNVPSGTTVIMSSNGKRLKIEKGTHAPGEVYNYRCTATSGSTTGSAIFSFEILDSEPVALMNIENGTVSNGIPLVLDASRSYDPSHNLLSYSWTCNDPEKSSTCLASSGNKLISSNDGSSVSFSIPASDLVLGSVLDISLTLTTSDNRSAVQSKTIEVVDGGNISIQTVPILSKISIHRHLIVSLTISSGSSVRWSQIPSQTIPVSSSLTVPYLWIKPFQMEEGESYTFQAAVTDSNGKSVHVLITWTTNKGPICRGELQRTSSSGRLTTIGVEDCYDLEETDSPLKYSFGMVWNGFVLPYVYGTLSPSLTIWTLPGTKQFVVYVCDSLGTCITKESTIAVRRDRVLNDETTLQVDFNEAKSLNSDLVPLAISDLSNAYNLTETDWVFLFEELSLYTSSLLLQIGGFDEMTVSALIGTIAGLLTEYSAMSSSHVVQGLDYTISLIQNAQYKLADLDINLVSNIVSGLVANYDSDSDIISKVLELQTEVNNLQFIDAPPGMSSIAVSSSTDGFVAITHRVTGEEIINGYSISASIGADVYLVSLQNITQIFTEDLIDVDLIVTSSLAFSDSVTVNLYKSGYYNKETLELVYENERTYLSIENLENPINITIPFEAIETLEYGVYVLRDSEWIHDETVTMSNEDTMFTIRTVHLSSFQIREMVPELIVPSDEEEDCSWHFAPLILISVFVIVSAILIIFALVIERKKENDGSKYKDEEENEESKNMKSQATESTEEVSRGFNMFFAYHPILGQLKKQFAPVERAAELGLSLMLNLLVLGLFMMGFETVEENKEEVNPDSYLYYGVFSSLISFLVILMIELTKIFEKEDQKGNNLMRWVVIGFLFLVSFTVSSIFIGRFCENWSKIWAVVCVFGISIEWVIFHSVYALIRLLIVNRKKIN